MGLFDILKKKEVTTVTAYSPWDKGSVNSDADYANVVFLNMFSHKAQPIGKSPDDYPRYVSYELNIPDPIKKHKELIKRGYLRDAISAETLDAFKVADLKSILEANGLPAKGKKAELISQIVKYVDPVKLKLPAMYCVSEKGLEYLAEHDDFIKLHGNPYNISYQEFIAVKAKIHKACKFNDIIWSVFEQRDWSFAIDDYSSKRSNALHRGMFLKSENRLTDALYYFIEVLFYDIHGSTFDEIIPYIKTQIFELKDYYLPQMVHRCYRNITLPNAIPEKAFEYVLNGIFQGD